jgi:hypothetical protein
MYRSTCHRRSKNLFIHMRNIPLPVVLRPKDRGLPPMSAGHVCETRCSRGRTQDRRPFAECDHHYRGSAGGSRTHKVVIRVLHLLKQATSVGVQLFCAWIISSYSPSHETSVEERAERLLGSAYWNVSLYRKDFE